VAHDVARTLLVAAVCVQVGSCRQQSGQHNTSPWLSPVGVVELGTPSIPEAGETNAPQRPARWTLINTSVALSILGTGIVSTLTECGPWMTTARIVAGIAVIVGRAKCE
jgi:hypothetical protein